MEIDITKFEGLVSSPADERDFIASGAVSQDIKRPEDVPAPFDLVDYNQFDNSASYYACVACAMSGLKQQLSRMQDVTEDYDYKWLYLQCKAIDGLDPRIQGTTLKAVLTVAKNTGIKTTKGLYRKIKEYKKIENPNNQAQLETAIFLYHGVIAAVTLSNDGWHGDTVRQPLPGENTAGHGIVLNGYDNGAYIGQDSMPSYHNNIDQFRMKKTYPITEAWAVTLDDDIPASVGISGWIADITGKIKNEILTSPANLRDSANGKFIRLLDTGTKVQILGYNNALIGGYNWIEVNVIL